MTGRWVAVEPKAGRTLLALDMLFCALTYSEPSSCSYEPGPTMASVMLCSCPQRLPALRICAPESRWLACTEFMLGE